MVFFFLVTILVFCFVLFYCHEIKRTASVSQFHGNIMCI